MMSICFLMPCVGDKPIGGFKVIYEQANRLVTDGFIVHIVYPACSLLKNRKKKLRGLLGGIYRFIMGKTFRGFYMPNKWFCLDARISQHFVWNLAEKNIPQCDVICATAVETSIYLNEYKNSKIKKIYYIQDFENWGLTSEQVLSTYRFPIKKITIAPWLAEKINNIGESCTLIPNGLDFSYFGQTNAISARNSYSVCMLYHTMEKKRCSDAIAALNIVKQKFAQLSVKAFGVFKRGKELPEWFDYYQLPSKETHNYIYNESAVFVAASSIEGFGLTVGEAMICGCAIACTDNGGFSMMVKHNETGLLSPVFDIQSMADNIITLITDNNKRIKLAEAGSVYIRQFTWEKTYSAFKKLLCLL